MTTEETLANLEKQLIVLSKLYFSCKFIPQKIIYCGQVESLMDQIPVEILSIKASIIFKSKYTENGI